MEKVMESHGISKAEKSTNPVRCDTKGLSKCLFEESCLFVVLF